ncbi:hypothetical protein ACYZUD_31790 [Pseudomonas sp. XS1P51]
MTVYESYKALTPQQQRLYNNRVMLGNLPKQLNDPATLPNVQLLPATADDPGDQLKAGDRIFPLDVHILPFPDASSPDRELVTVQLMWDGSLVGAPQNFRTPLADINTEFPMKFTLADEYINNPGPHKLSYKQTYGANETFATDLLVNIDMAAPVPVGKVKVPSEVEVDGVISKSYLDTHGFVLLSINEYGGAKIDDKIEFRYGKSIAASRLIEVVVRDTLAKPMETKKLTKEFIGTEEGEHSLFYRLLDRKDNASAYSEFLVLGVMLSDPPQNLKLDVELHDDDNKILVEDAQTPVTVVLTYDNWLRGDRLVLSVDGQIPSIETDITQLPFVMPLTYKYLQNGNDGPKTVPLNYQVKRGSLSFPKVTTPKDLNIDLVSPVPVDPENPGLPGFPHPDLLPVTVQGTATSDPNKIRAADLVADVDASVLIYKGHKPGQVVSLHWNGPPVPADPVKGKGGVYTLDGSETDATILTFTIKADLITAGGNDVDLLVHYNVEHPLNENFNRSQDAIVDVHIVAAVIPKPTFMHTVGGINGPTLYCLSMRKDSFSNWVIEVQVPGGENQLADQDLEFVYQGYLNDTSDPVDDKPGAAIPGNTVTVLKTPSAVEARDGFVVQVPYAPFAITDNGWGQISYTAKIDGQPASTESDMTKVTMRIAGGTCPL